MTSVRSERRRRRARHWKPITLALAAAMFLAACGDDQPSDEGAATDPAAEAPATPDVSAGGAQPVASNPGEPAAEASAPAEAGPVLEVRELNSWYRVVIINEPALTDPLELETIGREICEGLAPCRAAMWFDADEAPAGFPVLEMNLQAQIFGFGRTEAGAENILWNCDFFPEFEADRRCLPRPMN